MSRGEKSVRATNARPRRRPPRPQPRRKSAGSLRRATATSPRFPPRARHSLAHEHATSKHDQHIRWRAHGVQHNRAHWHATNVNGLSTMKNIQKIYKCHGSCSMLDARLFGHPPGRSLRSKGDALTGQWPRRRSTSLSKSSPRGSIPMFPMFCSATHICSGVGQPLSSYMLRSTGSPSTGS